MSINKTIACLALGVVAVGCPGWFGTIGSIEVMATKPLPRWPISVGLESESLPAKSGPAAFLLTVNQTKHFDESCDSIVISVTNKRGTAYTGPDRWAILPEEATPYTHVLNLTIPDNDTCAIAVEVRCGRSLGERRWFVSTGDTLEMYAQHPVGVAGRYKPRWSDVMRAKFTPEQLNREFDFRLDLRHAYPAQRDSVEMLFGTMQPSDIPDVYLIRTSLDNWIKLSGDWRISITPVDDDAFNSEFPAVPGDSPPPDTSSGDSSKPQGYLDNGASPRGTGAISLERVTGLTGANTLTIGQPVT